jgi:hypothetical protein
LSARGAAPPIAGDLMHPVIQWLMTDGCAQAERRQRISRCLCASVARRGRGCRAHHHRRSDAGDVATKSLGVFSLKGVGSEQEIYAPVAPG